MPGVAGKFPLIQNFCTARCRTWCSNAIDALPQGGEITVRTQSAGDQVAILGFRHRLRINAGRMCALCSLLITQRSSTAPDSGWP